MEVARQEILVARHHKYKDLACLIGQPGVNFWLSDRKKWLSRAAGCVKPRKFSIEFQILLYITEYCTALNCKNKRITCCFSIQMSTAKHCTTWVSLTLEERQASGVRVVADTQSPVAFMKWYIWAAFVINEGFPMNCTPSKHFATQHNNKVFFHSDGYEILK